MKPKIIFMLLIFMLVVPMISAADWDNCKYYDEDSQTMTIKNLCVGPTLVRMQLMTPHNNHVADLGEGIFQEVAIIKLHEFDDSLESAFSGMDIYDLTSGQLEDDREYKLKYRVTVDEWEEDIIDRQCTTTNNISTCNDIVVGTEIKEIHEWVEFTDISELPYQNIFIGVFVDVKIEEHGEWIPNKWFGEEIEEWASWTAGLNVDLVRVWQFDEGSGTTVSEELANDDLIVTGTEWIASGVDQSAYLPTGDFNISTLNPDNYPAMTISFWMNRTQNPASNGGILSTGNSCGSAGDWFFYVQTDGEIGYCAHDGGQVTETPPTYTPPEDQWVNVVFIINATDINLFASGESFQKKSLSGFDFSNKNMNVWRAFAADTLEEIGMDELYIWNRTLTEAEIITLNDSTFYSALLSNLTILEPTNSTYISSRTEINVTVGNDVTDCWYSDDGGETNTSITCGNNATGLSSGFGSSTWMYSVNNSGNVQNNTYVTFSVVQFAENSQTFNTTTVETSNEGFTLNMSYDSDSYNVITGLLNYNNTDFVGTNVGTGDNAIFTYNLETPVISSQENKTFFWKIGLTNTTTTTWFNSTENNQSINVLSMSLCGDPNTVPFINFTIKDEETLGEINGTFSSTFTYSSTTSSTTKTFSYSYTATNLSKYDFCFSPPDKSYSLSSSLQYAAEGYTTKFYDFTDIEVSNATTFTDLYLLNVSDSTSFVIKVRDSGFVDIPDASVHVQRFDIGSGEWITTEIVITNYEGKAVGHLFTEDADYRFLIYVNEVLVLTSGTTKIVCEVVPCTVTLTVPQGEIEELFPYETLSQLTTSLSYTEATNFFTYTYQDSDSDFIEARLLVQRVDVGGGDLLAPACNVTDTSAVGVLTCDISSTTFLNGTYVATGYNSRTGNLDYQTDRIIVKKFTTIRNSIGVDGVLWSLFFLITIVMLGVYRPSLAIIFSIIGMIVLSLLRIVDISWLALTSIIAIAIILLIEVKKQ